MPPNETQISMQVLCCSLLSRWRGLLSLIDSKLARHVEVSLVSAAILDKVPPQMPPQDGFVERQQQVQAPSGDVVYVTVLVKGPADGPIVPPLTHGHAVLVLMLSFGLRSSSRWTVMNGSLVVCVIVMLRIKAGREKHEPWTQDESRKTLHVVYSAAHQKRDYYCRGTKMT